MSMQRWIRRSAPLAVAAIASAAPAAFAQSRLIGLPGMSAQQGPGAELFEWTGQVDREVQIVMRGNRVWTNNVGQTERPRARERTFTQLPFQDGQVAVQRMDGRGNVDVIQQPSRQNNYTTIVRITDPRGGSDTYRVAAYWQGYANGEVYGNNGNGVGRGRGRVDSRRRRDDDDDDRRGSANGDRGIYNPNGTYNPNGGYNQAGGQEVFHWSGNVDGELEIRIQNGRVSYSTVSGAQPTNIRAVQGNVDIRQGDMMVVAVNQSRGAVEIVQQPQNWNGYTTVVRVRDPQGGYGYYDFSLLRR